MEISRDFFVSEHSIVRRIWGKSDTILFIFAGAAAEFALNKTVDWLYFTGKLPADPIGRLFSTVGYAKQIVFADLETANNAIDKITSIHQAVEKSRNSKIPDWAYRDVLYMLIYYSKASFELWERKLSKEEENDLYDVFFRMGNRMNIKDLPLNYDDWILQHEMQLRSNLIKSELTVDLFKQYHLHLGNFRYWLLIESQKMLVPPKVMELLGYKKNIWTKLIPVLYKITQKIKLDGIIKTIILPKKYKLQIKELDRIPA